MVQNANPNPVVILVSETGANLIKAVCNSALKQNGMEALQAVNLIMSNMRGIAPPQVETPVAKKEEKPEKPPRTIPIDIGRLKTSKEEGK